MNGGAMPPAWTPPGDGASERTARRLVAVPWRHAGLIVLCALVGAAAAALVQRHSAPTPVARTARVEAAMPAPARRMGATPKLADIEALLRQAPPAAARFAALDVAPWRGGLVPGLVAGLLLGLLLAAARELRGDRMRSPRDAERALGAPVLGAVPTLSARARRRLLAPAARRDTSDRR